MVFWIGAIEIERNGKNDKEQKNETSNCVWNGSGYECLH